MQTWVDGNTRAVWTDSNDGSLGHGPPRGEHDESCCGEEITSRRASLRPNPWLSLTQVHGDSVVVFRSAEEVEGLKFSEADAVVTDAPDVTLAIATADCAPIALSSPEGVIGAVHAGWKGLQKGVLRRAADEMRALGASSISAALGPCIHVECYEFGAEGLADFVEEWGPEVAGATGAGSPAFDLPAAVKAESVSAGVNLVEISNTCTACDQNFFSYRARGSEGRQVLLVWQ